MGMPFSVDHKVNKQSLLKLKKKEYHKKMFDCFHHSERNTSTKGEQKVTERSTSQGEISQTEINIYHDYACEHNSRKQTLLVFSIRIQHE